LEEDGKQKEYPVTLDVLKMIDARTVRIPDYGSLVGRIARLLAVVLSKEVDKAEGDKEPVVKTIKGRKFDVNLEIAEVMPFLEDKHQDFLDMLYTIFPPAKKRMSQFIEKALTKFDLRIETAKEVDKLIAEKEKREKEERDQKKREEEEKRRAEEAKKRAEHEKVKEEERKKSE